MKKVYNFSAGPAVLPDPVLTQAAEAVINYNGHGMSILEMSHRSAPIVDACPWRSWFTLWNNLLLKHCSKKIEHYTGFYELVISSFKILRG